MIISKILQMGCRARYALVTDFLWYVSVLQRLACMQSSGCDVVDSGEDNNGAEGHEESMSLVQSHSGGTTYGYGYDSSTRYSRHGREVADQLMEIALRVENSRAFVVECMISLLMNSQLLLQGPAKDTVSEVFLAASWIVGEYTSILMDIMLDRKQGDEDDESDSGSDDSDSDGSGGDDDGHWIEGPDGTELRSRWRKLPLHLLLIETLLHPRVTTLPPRVQGSFIHAALKIFIAAVTPEYPMHYLAQIVTYLRLRLPLFLQSVHLEVQERAATFYQLLQEFHVLIVEDDGGIFRDAKPKSSELEGSDDEDDADGDDADTSNNIDQTVEDLLIFLPEEPMTFQNTLCVAPAAPSVTDRSTPGIAAAQHAHHSAVLGAHPSAADRKGAARALSHQGPLRVLSAESFYTVHPKAQRKVPVPMGVDLELSFNSKALRKVLNVEEPANPSIGSLSFLGKDRATTASYFDSSSKSGSSSYTSEYDGAGNDPSNSDFGGGGSMFRESSSGSNYQEDSTFDTRNRNTNQDHFYIKSSNCEVPDDSRDDDEISAGQRRRAEYEDILVGGVSTEVRKKDKKNKSSSSDKKYRKKDDGKKKDKAASKSKSKSKNKTASLINQVDLIPGGESLSEDDVVSDRTSKKKKKMQSGEHSDDSDAGLEDIDITRPLRASDVLPVHKHRETPSHQDHSNATNTALGGTEDNERELKRKSKQSSKEKKDKKEKKHKKEKMVKTRADNLGGDNDLLGLASEQPASVSKTSKSKSHSKGKTKSTSQIWIPFYEADDNSLDVSYAMNYNDANGEGAGQVNLCYRVENRGAPLSMSLLLASVPDPFQTCQSPSLLAIPGTTSAPALPVLELATALPTGEERVVTPGPEHTLSLNLSTPDSLLSLLQIVQGGGIPVTLQYSRQETSLLDASGDSSSSARKLLLSPTICSFCCPLSLTPSQFSDILINNDGVFGRAKTQLSVNAKAISKPKSVCKLVSKYLRCHEVESVGDGNAMSISSHLGPRGGELGVTICVLLKVRKSSSMVGVEVKCFSKRGQQLSQQVADLVVAAVDLMDLL